MNVTHEPLQLLRYSFVPFISICSFLHTGSSHVSLDFRPNILFFLEQLQWYRVLKFGFHLLPLRRKAILYLLGFYFLKIISDVPSISVFDPFKSIAILATFGCNLWTYFIISILNFPRWLQCSSKFEKPWAGAEAGAGAQVPQGQCAWEYVWGAGRQGAGDQMSRDKPGNIQAGDVGGTRAVVNGRARERSAIWGNKSWYEFRTWYGLSKKMRTEWVWQDSY